tara:strand:+ start:315 stop:827 length:513 start_codon:yes stop_codon:yes gene_type:complete
MNTEVEINTNVDVEFDDDAVWEAIEDRVEREIQSNLESYEPWDSVSGDVENYVEDAISDHGGRIDWSDGDEHLESLLDQFSTRIRNGESLCTLGRSARKAIEAVIELSVHPSPDHPFPLAEDTRVDQIRIDQDLDVQQRLNTLERQVKTLLAAITALGERAASVTPDSVV